MEKKMEKTSAISFRASGVDSAQRGGWGLEETKGALPGQPGSYPYSTTHPGKPDLEGSARSQFCVSLADLLL